MKERLKPHEATLRVDNPARPRSGKRQPEAREAQATAHESSLYALCHVVKNLCVEEPDA